MMDQNDVKRAVVVGAGVMGHSIVHVSAQAGIKAFERVSCQEVRLRALHSSDSR